MHVCTSIFSLFLFITPIMAFYSSLSILLQSPNRGWPICYLNTHSGSLITCFPFLFMITLKYFWMNRNGTCIFFFRKIILFSFLSKFENHKFSLDCISKLFWDQWLFRVDGFQFSRIRITEPMLRWEFLATKKKKQPLGDENCFSTK